MARVFELLAICPGQSSNINDGSNFLIRCRDIREFKIELGDAIATSQFNVIGASSYKTCKKESRLIWIDAIIDRSRIGHDIVVMTYGGSTELLEGLKRWKKVYAHENVRRKSVKGKKFAVGPWKLNPEKIFYRLSPRRPNGKLKKNGNGNNFEKYSVLIPEDNGDKRVVQRDSRRINTHTGTSLFNVTDLWAMSIRVFEVFVELIDGLYLTQYKSILSLDFLWFSTIEYLKLVSDKDEILQQLKEDEISSYDFVVNNPLTIIEYIREGFNGILNTVHLVQRPLSFTDNNPLEASPPKNRRSKFLQALTLTRESIITFLTVRQHQISSSRHALTSDR